ncbi:hypothetical protein CDEST_13987 [Colletotrichum destructivum]|uniref:Uncharacterized protein n=1 Tax=Colletotrichum destructivum TaxID=34406 RepID=A0AAX4J0M4_9PEZI|nr:hypothetical protein CDEST_13987 [Colletotrichum destructivum]
MPSSGRTWQTSVPGENEGWQEIVIRQRVRTYEKRKPRVRLSQQSIDCPWCAGSNVFYPSLRKSKQAAGSGLGELFISRTRSAHRGMSDSKSAKVKNGVSRTELLVQGTDTSGSIRPIPLSRILSLIVNLKRRPG